LNGRSSEKAEIRKSDDGKAIRISNNQNSAEIKLNDTEATLKKINGDITLKVKKENGKLNIYEKRNVVSNYKYRSALIFGPPGSGKSTIAKALAKRLGWDYVELSPSLFLSEGDQNIIPKAIEIFKRLVRMKETATDGCDLLARPPENTERCNK
jgi:SpoVK/Ycf46/Vps4 family AAA+-type ATPase